MMPRQFGAMLATPVTRGARVKARLFVLALAAVPALLVGVAPFVAHEITQVVMEIAGWLLGISLVLMLCLIMLTTSTTLGGRLVGFRFVDTRTGRGAGGVLLIRSLVQGLFEAGTLGLGVLVGWATYRDGQHWFDRVFNLVAVPADAEADGMGPAPGYAPEYSSAKAVDLPIPAPAPLPVFRAPSSVTASPYSQATPVRHRPLFREGEQPEVFPASAPTGTAFPTPWPARVPSPVEVEEDPLPTRALRAIADADLSDEETVADPVPAVASRSIPEVVLDDGRTIEVDCPIVLGRNPLVPEGHPTARCVPVLDSTKRLSKTHLLLVPEAGTVAVVDMGATNGVFVDSAGRRIRLVPHQPRLLAPRDAVHFGGRTLELL